MKKKYLVNAVAKWHVHVGGGDENKLDPLGYVVKETEGKSWFYRIDIGAMMSADRTFAEAFTKITEQQDAIGRLRRLIFDAFDPEKKSTWFHRASVSKSFLITYLEKVNDLRVNNQLLVQCLPFAAGKTYIPGSSIKGAVRTAVLDKLACNKNYNSVFKEVSNFDARSRGKETEKYLLCYNDIKYDPFKALKISDAKLPDDSTMIVEVKNVPQNDDPISLDMFVEVIKPGTAFQFQISIEDEYGMNGINLKKLEFTFDDIMEKCRDYYLDAINDEAQKFYKEDSNADIQVQNAMSTVYDDDDKLIPGVSIMRVGRFSHLESMTYNDRGEGKLCQPKPPFDPKTHKQRSWGGTRNLVDGKYPLGVITMTYNEIKQE